MRSLSLGAALMRPGALARRGASLELTLRDRGAAGMVAELLLRDVAARVRGALEVYGYEVARAEHF